MTSLKISGVHRRTAKGRVYYYHRATGVRIKADPSDFAAFANEVASLNAGKPVLEKPKALSTLGGLIAAYKRSPEYAGLAPDTRKSYQRAFDAVATLDALPADELDQRAIMALRDKVYGVRGRWLANMVVAVLSVVLGWGVPRGFVSSNGASGVPKIKRNRKMGVANKAWLWPEVDVALKRATGGLRKAIALAYFTGMRKKDIVEALSGDRVDGRIERLSSKPGVQITVFEAKRLSAILDEQDAAEGDALVRTKKGTAYTRDGLDTLFHRLKVKLVSEGLIRPGLTFHGLRKSLGRDAAGLGFSENDIAGALGQTNPASARTYTVEHRQREAARKVIRALERRGKR